MEKRDKVIWDSGFGYEIGEFIKHSVAQENHSIIVPRSGISCNKQLCLPSAEISPYTDDLANELSKKYSCITKTFKKEPDGGSI